MESPTSVTTNELLLRVESQDARSFQDNASAEGEPAVDIRHVVLISLLTNEKGSQNHLPPKEQDAHARQDDPATASTEPQIPDDGKRSTE